MEKNRVASGPEGKVCGRFPSEGQHRKRWRELARAIAAESSRINDAPELTQTPGELEVLGSGIEAAGFTASDEARITEADQVFYCVADPATMVWLKDLRPDAYDLYVLYDDSKQRYLTYMQMAEAMLHYVRQGQRVVAVYYGHPGIFVLSTHRAIQIARREGHRAVMRPGISALDTLCADLGVDPSQPGMQMYEATDLLLRSRRPDLGLHLVLWQVGLIGDLGYRRQGHINGNFPILLDYLEALYGAGHPVINYVGSRYPGVEPVIDRQTIRSLRVPGVQERVTGISTFYLPPKEIAPADEEMLTRLGLLQPGQTVRQPGSPLRIIDRYGERERAAFKDFADFDIPGSYRWQADTAPARFILSLRDDGELRQRYGGDPAGAVRSWNGDLSVREKRMLASRDAGAMQIAAKGVRVANPENRRTLLHLLSRKTATRSLLKSLRRAGVGQGLPTVERWGRDQGFSPDWHELPEDLELLLRQSLYPWTGLYLAQERELSLAVHGGRDGGESLRVDLNGRRLQGAQFRRGVLSWSAEDGNDCSGHLQAHIMPGGGVRRLVGAVWPPATVPGSEHQVVAWEHVLAPTPPPCLIAGRYIHRGHDGRERHISIEPLHDSATGPGVRVVVDGRTADRPVSVGADGFRLGEDTVSFRARLRDDWPPAHLQGKYRVRVRQGRDVRLTRLDLDDGTMSIAGEAVAGLRWNGAAICWDGGPAAAYQGEINALLDPISLRPMLFGRVRSAADEVLELQGMVPITEAEQAILAAHPQMELPGWAWEHISGIVAGASRKGGLFLWHGWEQRAVNLRRIRTVLRELRQHPREH